jgi:hypothetical protein
MRHESKSKRGAGDEARLRCGVLHEVVEVPVEDGGWDQVRVRRRCSVMLDVNFGMEREVR